MAKKQKNVVEINTRKANLKRRIRRHLKKIGFEKNNAGELIFDGEGKEAVRSLHLAQRKERLEKCNDLIKKKSGNLIKHFASGHEVIPDEISIGVHQVKSGTWQSDLFKLASLTWSVPVSSGFGRRLRYLVWDKSNGKLMGLMAIGDPVFNLAVRDNLIGWDSAGRRARLVNIMDAYVLGAIPPYNSLLVGKLIACLLRSRELYDDFETKYGNTVGIISKEKKNARLLAIMTSSSMGRSSVYNRLKLDGTQYMESIGYTGGWGNFHIPDKIFLDMRKYLNEIQHKYADENRYGDGPSWRLRAIRKALTELGFREDLLRHGIRREVFVSFLAENSREILQTGKGKPDLSSLRPYGEIERLAMDRWVLPRAERQPDYQNWTIEDLIGLFGNKSRAIGAEVDKIRRAVNTG